MALCYLPLPRLPQEYRHKPGSPFLVRTRLARHGAIVVAMVLAFLASRQRAQAEQRNFTLTAARTRVSIGAGLAYLAWTYDGTVPGPTLQVNQDDEVKIRLFNRTSDAHGIEVQGAQLAPSHFSGDPAATVSYDFKALVPGVFDYHCSAIPVLDHVASGMYGVMIVEPRGGWPHGKAQEITLVQGEFYGTPDANGLVVGDHSRMLSADPNFIVFNGALGRYGRSNPIPIRVGELVRIFFLNAGPNLNSTFHLPGVVFSTVYVSGNPTNVLHDIPGFQVAPGQGAVFEFKVNEEGDYSFADIAGAHSYKGALGLFRAAK